jgi:hypothetical protein
VNETVIEFNEKRKELSYGKFLTFNRIIVVKHNLSLSDDVLRELHRVLKSDGTLSFSVYHMNEKDIRTKITNTGLFKLLTKGRKTYRFSKVD